jgi:Ca2+-binding EF-hand superfamily protein
VTPNSLGFEFTEPRKLFVLFSELDSHHTRVKLVHSKMCERKQIEELRSAFEALDDDSPGHISLNNLKRVGKGAGGKPPFGDAEQREMLTALLRIASF